MVKNKVSKSTTYSEGTAGSFMLKGVTVQFQSMLLGNFDKIKYQLYPSYYMALFKTSKWTWLRQLWEGIQDSLGRWVMLKLVLLKAQGVVLKTWRKNIWKREKLIAAHCFKVFFSFTSEFSDLQINFENSWVKHFELSVLLTLFLFHTTSKVVFSC